MKKYGALVLLLAIVPLVTSVYAQGGSLVQLSGGYTISLPSGWEQAESEGVYTFSQGDLSIVLTLPDVLASKLELANTMDAADVLVEVYATMSDQTLDKETDIEAQMSGERAMATHEFQTDDGAGRGISAVLEVAPGKFALMEFHAPADAYETALPDALQIMESLEVSPAAGVSAVPCRVRAASTNVDLRVGPGTNRGIYTSMSSGTDYGVLGKKTVSGGLWWRLDMDTGSANELWVADADVETSGGCDQVADVDAPPVIFGPPPAPVPAPSSENPSGSAPTPNPSRVPANGKWYFAVAPEFMVSCEGGDTERFSTADFGFVPFTAQITASPDGSSLTLSDSGGTLVFYGQDGYYQTGENLGDAYLAWHLYVSSPTRMGSDITVTLLSAPCSGTIPISVQYLG